jgi:hypothetical protein
VVRCAVCRERCKVSNEVYRASHMHAIATLCSRDQRSASTEPAITRRSAVASTEKAVSITKSTVVSAPHVQQALG